MKILPAMIAIAERLDALNRAVPKGDAAAVHVALSRASDLMCAHARMRFLSNIPPEMVLVRRALGETMAKAMGQPDAGSPRSDDPGASPKAIKARIRRKAAKSGKKRGNKNDHR